MAQELPPPGVRDAGSAGTGLILGKFLPPHAGHLFLVKFARRFVDRLFVLVCSIDREPIPGEKRYTWMRESIGGDGVELIHICEELPQEPADHPDFWAIWRRVVTDAVGRPIDYVFTSEAYGPRLAAEVGAAHIPVDPPRQTVPTSGTAIRDDPMSQWRFIPPAVRPHYVKRVCIFGPESTGKSTLAADLADAFDTVCVPEFARGLLDPKGGRCEEADIPLIARGQAAAEDSLARQANRVMFCDTDALTTTIWSHRLFGQCPASVEALAATRRYDLTLLLDVDVPWVDDAQRFLGGVDERRDFYRRCESALRDAGRSYVRIGGDWSARFDRSRALVDALVGTA